MASIDPAAPAVPEIDIRLPAAGLRSYITFHYFVTAAGPLTDFLYPEWGNVRFVLDGTWRLVTGDSAADGDALFGPTDRCGHVTTAGGRLAGFGLTPLGWHRLIGTDASRMANRAAPVGTLCGVEAATLRDALAADDAAAGTARVDALLGGSIATRPPEDPLVVTVDRVLRDRPRDVVAFAAAAGVSARTLHRICLRAFGFAPKRLLRRQRFLDTLGHVRTAVGDPLQAALDPDYCDQAHFYRDFRDFMGMSPRAYFSASRDLMARAAAAQAAAGVPLSFKLPPPPGGGARLGGDHRPPTPREPTDDAEAGDEERP